MHDNVERERERERELKINFTKKLTYWDGWRFIYNKLKIYTIYKNKKLKDDQDGSQNLIIRHY